MQSQHFKVTLKYTTTNQPTTKTKIKTSKKTALVKLSNVVDVLI